MCVTVNLYQNILPNRGWQKAQQSVDLLHNLQKSAWLMVGHGETWNSNKARQRLRIPRGNWQANKMIHMQKLWAWLGDSDSTKKEESQWGWFLMWILRGHTALLQYMHTHKHTQTYTSHTWKMGKENVMIYLVSKSNI